MLSEHILEALREKYGDNICPNCGAVCSDWYRIPYCGIGGVNYIIYTCHNCGEKFEVRD